MIIDTHVHVFGGDMKNPRMLEGVSGRLKRLGFSFETQVETLRTRMRDAGVDKALVYAVPNESVAKMLDGGRDVFMPFGRVTMSDPDRIVDELDFAVNSLGFKGLGELMLSAMHFYCDDFEAFDRLYKRLVDLDIPISWDLKPGARTGIVGGYRATYANIVGVQEVCLRYPELKHIICHIGGLDHYSSVLTTFSDYPNVYFDLSEISSSLMWRHMTPRSDREPGATGAHMQLLSYVYPERFQRAPSDRNAVVEAAKREAIAIFREAANVAPDRIMLGSDTPLVGRMDFEIGICRDAFGHDRELLENALGGNAKRLLKA